MGTTRNDLTIGTVFKYNDVSDSVWEVVAPGDFPKTPIWDGRSVVGSSDPAGWQHKSVTVLKAPSVSPKAILTTDKKARKEMPMARGLFDYFPRALAAVANVSFVANEQHNPGEPMHWDKTKSTDHADCLARHLIERGTVDDDGLRHSAKLAWRALALLETELETIASSV